MTTTSTTATMKHNVLTARGYEEITVLQTPVREPSSSEIPIIDISPGFSSSLAQRQAVARQIGDAAKRNGFFYIKNHGIASELCERLYKSSLDFFRQEMDAKKKSIPPKQAGSHDSEGYIGYDTEVMNYEEGADNCESFHVLYDPRHDPLIKDVASIPPDVAKHYPELGNQWRHMEHLPHFRDSVEAYFKEHLALCRALTRLFALSLDLEENFFDDKVRYPGCSMLVNYQLPIETSGRVQGHVPAGPSDITVSKGAHTDWQFFTVLWQCQNGGLEVLNCEGQWITVPPLEGTFVVNVADYLQRMTNDRYLSAIHRARNMSGRERVSIPFFWGFGLGESCAVLDTCLGDGEEKRYDEISCLEWVTLKSDLVEIKQNS